MTRGRWIYAALAAVMLATAGCEESPAQVVDAPAAEARAARGGFQRGAGGLLARAEALGLSERQVADIEAILAELKATNAPLMERLRAEGRPARGQPSPLMEQVRANGRAAMERVRAVLTAEQLEAAKALRSADGVRRRGGPGGPGGPGGGVAMLVRLRDELGLGDDQVARIEAIAASLKAKNAPLVEQLRASGERPRGREGAANPLVAQIRANGEAAREEAAAVLTAEQRATLATLRAERGDRPEGGRRGRRGPGRRGGGGPGQGG